MVDRTVNPTRATSPSEDGEVSRQSASDSDREDAPPLPDEEPPLPDEDPPDVGPQAQPTIDDGWEARFDPNTQGYYFFNRFTGVSQWDNPRAPQASGQVTGPPEADDSTQTEVKEPYMGYNPKIHGDFDPNADYAQFHEPQTEVPDTDAEAAAVAAAAAAAASSDPLVQTAAFNRFTGKFQSVETPDSNYHNDENKSKRQMNAFFDVDAAANSHDGRSLKEERVNQKLSKKEVKAFNDKRRERKEKKRRAFLMS